MRRVAQAEGIAKHICHMARRAPPENQVRCLSRRVVMAVSAVIACSERTRIWVYTISQGMPACTTQPFRRYHSYGLKTLLSDARAHKMISKPRRLQLNKLCCDAIGPLNICVPAWAHESRLKPATAVCVTLAVRGRPGDELACLIAGDRAEDSGPTCTRKDIGRRPRKWSTTSIGHRGRRSPERCRGSR